MRNEILADLSPYPLKLRTEYLRELAQLIEQGRIESAKLKQSIEKPVVAKSEDALQVPKETKNKLQDIRQFLINRGFEIYEKSQNPILAKHKIGLCLVINLWSSEEDAESSKPLTLKPISALEAYMSMTSLEEEKLSHQTHIQDPVLM